MTWRGLATVTAAIVMASCSSQSCHLVGCVSGVTFDLNAYASANPAVSADGSGITVCVDNDCDVPPTADRLTEVFVPVGDVNVKDRYRIKVTGVVGPAAAATLDTVLPWVRTQPNGPKCPPRCWHTTIHVAADGTLSATA